MSFYIKNLQNVEEIARAQQDPRRVVVMRFGRAETEEGRRIDQLISLVKDSVSRYFVFFGCELEDIPREIKAKYTITKEMKDVLIFFHRQQPLEVSFNQQPPSIHVVEPFSGHDDFLSLLVQVHQGVARNQTHIRAFASYAQHSTPPRPEHQAQKEETQAKSEKGLGTRLGAACFQ
ncbi:hypothetical protein NEDG_00148 [Nematocida displodere]|uniref:Uncharacterized protein n=1 Tax=Nematocida displodere TaxID=1805483 RepID=A0A177EI70_9MICR|nr:hypothetical protein NEDG_00148 [Nematocida displodere]